MGWRRTLGIAVASGLVGLLIVPARPALAVSPVRLTRIYFDSPGADYRSNSSLNAEYVVISNAGGEAVLLEGWTLRDAAGEGERA